MIKMTCKNFLYLKGSSRWSQRWRGAGAYLGGINNLIYLGQILQKQYNRAEECSKNVYFRLNFGLATSLGVSLWYILSRLIINHHTKHTSNRIARTGLGMVHVRYKYEHRHVRIGSRMDPRKLGSKYRNFSPFQLITLWTFEPVALNRIDLAFSPPSSIHTVHQLNLRS